MINQHQQSSSGLLKNKEIPNNILMGFWHNWPGDPIKGYQGGKPSTIDLTEIHHKYNVVVVSFMKVIEGSGDPIPNFIPFRYTDEEFAKQINLLHQQNRIVLISLGGADAHIEMHSGQEIDFSKRIIELSDRYGFDGLDIDLEQAAIDAADNSSVIPTALKLVKDHYKLKGKNFIISMAPEFPYLRESGKYTPYIKDLEGYYDFVAPQFYNQGGDGVWVDGGTGWLSQSDNTKKEDFLFFLTESIITGTRGYIKVPHNKFIIGLPSNIDAAGSGYVSDPSIIKKVFDRLTIANLPIKGLMTWSVNWDNGKSENGNKYNWEFASHYGDLNNDNSNETEIPEKPTGLEVLNINERSITIGWDLPITIGKIKKYRIYRNRLTVIDIPATQSSWEDKGLISNTEYTYQITAIDANGNESFPSNTVKATTLNENESSEPPLPPANLRLMGISDHYVNLMWGRLSGNNPLTTYVIYRDGIEVTKLQADKESYIDKNVIPNTIYRYFIAAIDTEGLWSVPSNVLSVHTKEPTNDSNPEWKINTHYITNTKVDYQNKTYHCLQTHTSNTGWTPIDTLNVLWIIS
ncbi:fibronectin type III domain-containing protein [Elizabethkingia anophelis]|uniref:fibronectin type III domain-containing protein n=1 Tax=Elizabethkingia anophelis TaxID=1117645 RepID=UPI0009D45168|nr:glycosyl hydrolase family 18 protein [Elizabethkingia anophelis]MCT4234930.1 fibronectin type III domain-containing protein [Elizabethkingia anophelis]OPC30699.1 hypothetical protein BAX98_08800 [Elizabethkingia anophelis]